MYHIVRENTISITSRYKFLKLGKWFAIDDNELNALIDTSKHITVLTKSFKTKQLALDWINTYGGTINLYKRIRLSR